MSTLLISFSGGRSSAMMLKLIFDSPEYSEYNKVVLFANTGKERLETLNFVKDCSDSWEIPVIWLEAVVHHDDRKSSSHRVTSYHYASRNGEPFEEVIKKYGIPNQSFPHCTRELKLNPMKSYMKSMGYGNYKSAIGIRFDEPRRLSNNHNFLYPLYDHRIKETDVREFWNNQPFDLQLKSYEGNCDLCWKKSFRKKKTIITENPGVSEWWDMMEKKYSEGEYFFNRGNQSVIDLVNDEREFVKSLDPYLDEEKACACRSILTEDL